MATKPLFTTSSFGTLALRAIARFPDRLALVDNAGELTFYQMGQRLAKLIAAYKQLGVKKGDGVALLTPNTSESWLARLAVNLIGARYTALHPLGSAEDHIYMVADSGSTALVVHPDYADRGQQIAAASPHLSHILTLGACDFGTDLSGIADIAEPAPLICEADPSDVLGLVYTGGTTGRSKGVVHRHDSVVLCTLMMLAEYEWPEHICHYSATPLSHAAGLFLLPAWVRGGCVVLDNSFDAARMVEAVQKYNVTTTFLVPTMIYVLLDHLKDHPADLETLKLIIYGASPMSPTRLKEGLDRFGPIFMQLYAQTEVPMTVTTLHTWDHTHEDRLASCGYPMTGVEVKLLDDDLAEVPQGEVGEICVRGPLIMEGYWNKPEETEAAFRGGWLHTGDMARADPDGLLFIVDRKKDMIISGGFNVFPKEVEDALSSHPAVAQAAVIGVPDEKWGEAVKGVVKLRPGANAGVDELIAHVRDKKGPVQTPKSIDFVDEIPVTGLGKPDKKALRSRYWGDSGRQVN